MAFLKGIVTNSEGGRVRYKHSGRTVKGALERFVKRNYTARKLQILFDGMTAKQKIELYMATLPYLIARPQADSLSSSEIDALFEKVQKQLEYAEGKKVG